MLFWITSEKHILVHPQKIQYQTAYHPVPATLLKTLPCHRNHFIQIQKTWPSGSGFLFVDSIGILGSEIEMEVNNECNRLIASCIIYYNAVLLSELFKKYKKENNVEFCDMIKRFSPVAWQHINLGGKYEFCQNQIHLNIQEVIASFSDDFKINYHWKWLVLAALQSYSEILRFWTINPNLLRPFKTGGYFLKTWYT